MKERELDRIAASLERIAYLLELVVYEPERTASADLYSFEVEAKDGPSHDEWPTK